jgi:ribosome-interacting GTPase 1
MRQIQTSDLILMVLDATKKAEQRALLEAELEAVGIRLNREPPNIYLKQKKAGGMKITFSAPPKNLDEKMIYNILRDYKMLNCEVLVRDENATVDDFIDVIMKDHRKYIRWWVTMLPPFHRYARPSDREADIRIVSMSITRSIPSHSTFSTNSPASPRRS